MQPDEIVKSVIAKLEYVKTVPVNELETGLDEVQLKVVDLRDRLIEQCRRESNPGLRRYLQQINVALSLIFGLEYPITGFQRNKIDKATGVLKELAGMPV